MSDKEEEPKTWLLLGEINGKLDGLGELISLQQRTIIEMQTKVIGALIGLAAAVMGLKLLGTPPLAVIARSINLFVFSFALIMAVMKRRTHHGWQYVLLFGLFGMLGNLYYLIFHDHEWLRTTIFILANSSMGSFVWIWGRWGNNKSR